MILMAGLMIVFAPEPRSLSGPPNTPPRLRASALKISSFPNASAFMIS